MSQWTHVAGVIRFDGLLNMTPKPNLGKTVVFEDPEEKWDKCNVPMGSEGSLEHNLITNPHESSMAKWVATIWGDLRDYDNADEIIEYFKRITKGQMVRNGVFTINIEGSPDRTFIHGENEWKEVG